MSSYSTRPGDKERDNGNHPNNDNEEDEDESLATESEADHLLLSYRKEPPKKRSSAPARRVDPESPIGTRNGDEVVVVSIEHFETPGDRDVESAATSPSDIWLQNESTDSSACLLRDVLPHMSESNTNAVLLSSSPTSGGQTTLLSKTYTEPTSLSGLLRQVGNRLFSHYPSRVVRRHSKISPTTSVHCKLDDADDSISSQTTVLSTTSPTAAVNVDENASDITENVTTARPESFSSPSSCSPSTTVRRFLEQDQENRRKLFPAKSPLCKRCPHCRKTCLLRKPSIPENLNKNESPSNSCACRICMILESVESNLSSPASDTGKISNNLLGSTASVDPSAFPKATEPLGDSQEGLIGPRHASLGGISLELGLLCDECNTARSGAEKADEHLETRHRVASCQLSKTPQLQKSREQGIQVNSSSMISIATTSSFGGPVCRICHSPGDKLEPLISPCRCLGTLKYVHASCLLHWLDISSRKLRRPPHCELCSYRYQRHKTMKLRRIQWPTCSHRDKLYHVLFMASVLMMIACAAVTIVCFKADRPTRNVESVIGGKTANSVSANSAVAGTASNGNGGAAATSPHVELTGQEVITLVCGILFFCAFFVAMYVQVKAQTTVYKLCVRFWAMNQEWRVDEYRREKDVEYWRQRQEQQMLQQQQQQQRRPSAQSVGGTGSHHTTLMQQNEQRQTSRPSLSSLSFHADVLYH